MLLRSTSAWDKATVDGGTIADNGLVNLADHSLNLRVTAVLNKTLSLQVGGSQIGGFMHTALANGQNELVAMGRGVEMKKMHKRETGREGELHTRLGRPGMARKEQPAKN